MSLTLGPTWPLMSVRGNKLSASIGVGVSSSTPGAAPPLAFCFLAAFAALTFRVGTICIAKEKVCKDITKCNDITK